MWLFSLAGQDPTIPTWGWGTICGALVTAVIALWRRILQKDKQLQAYSDQAVALTREVVPVLTEVTSELRRLIDHRERDR